MSSSRYPNSPLQKINTALRSLAKWFIHSPHYRPTGGPLQQTKYDDLARVYPFCPPDVEQRAWLERQYQELPEE